VVSLLALAACNSATSTAGTQDSSSVGPSANGQTGSVAAGDPGRDCTRATKATLVETPSPEVGHRYSFNPPRLTVQRGGFVALTNTSGRVHTLVSRPDAGIVTSVLGRKERQIIQFPQEGTFTVESASAAHRAVLQVTVTGESGCGAPRPTLTIDDGYIFTPTTLSVTATENFAVVNNSGAAQSVICTPDPGGNRDNPQLVPGETTLLAIDQPGRYVCGSVRHPEAKVTITVSGA
jgi:plastocyanin